MRPDDFNVGSINVINEWRRVRGIDDVPADTRFTEEAKHRIMMNAGVRKSTAKLVPAHRFALPGAT